MLLIACLLAFYLAWNLGANDVANAMGTSVGSKALTLRQALLIAAVLESAGAFLFGRPVSSTLATHVVNLENFAQAPHLLNIGMLTVLLAGGLWMHLATAFGLPVSSSHAVVGAIAGVAWAAHGLEAIDWPTIRLISLMWMITPLVSGAIAAIMYDCLRRWVLAQPDPLLPLAEWLPWLSAAFVGVFGVIVVPPLLVPGFTISETLPAHTVALAIGGVMACLLTWVSWHWLTRATNSNGLQKQDSLHSFSITEKVLARFQVLSACFVSFAHGSNDVGNAIAPLAVVVQLQQGDGLIPPGFQVPLWTLALGGLGIVGGLAVWGQRVITTIGEEITSLQPSGGVCAELATATTVLLASRLGFPVSTSHALVGALVGIGLTQANHPLQGQTLRSIGLAWVGTIPMSAGLSALIFWLISQIAAPFLETGHILG